MPITLRIVESRRDVDLFWEAGFAAQGHDPSYVPPLKREMHVILTPKATPFLRANDGQAWVAMRDGQPVGRIYAIKHLAHLETHHDGAGHFGFMEAIDDDAVWDALFAAACDFLRARGLTKIGGPYSMSINHQCGLLVDGFGTPATSHTNHAQPWYARQFERLGLKPVRELHGYEGRLAESRFPERVAAARARWAGSADLKLRRSDGGTADTLHVNALFNDGWADNWGAVPVDDEEALFLAHFLRPILRKGWTSFAEWRGESVGILAMIPDINEALAGLDGKLAPFGWARFLWRLKVAGTRRVRVPVIGVRRAWRGTRVGAMAAATLLADAVEQARAAKVERMEVSWMLDDNHAVTNLVASLPAKRTKVWRLYERAL